jgi:hypothetical protein
MNRKRPAAGDHDNVSFQILDTALHHIKPGFDSTNEEPPKKEGSRRFPRSVAEKVPKGSLADRLRNEERRGD